eukprot:TRINITY_DN56450_c0_g1_i1.p1 TRINITY_DN56450_c0_g1~~TRINITY_DN56450_c0_g1_i1.p1  ORF type:complete len:410 (-),score=49.39 TRINITY_DN56450_c0_g1_i1:48-1148(-)
MSAAKTTTVTMCKDGFAKRKSLFLDKATMKVHVQKDIVPRGASGIVFLSTGGSICKQHVGKGNHKSSIWDKLESGGYKKGPVIGDSGNRCFHVRSYHNSEKVIAVKITDEHRDDGVLHQHLRREYDILSKLSHPNIVAVERFVDSFDGCAVVMEVCPGRHLGRYVSLDYACFSWAKRRDVLVEVLGGITYLHAQHVCHGDVHPGNVVVDLDMARGVGVTVIHCVKLIDFGSSYHASSDSTSHLYDMNPRISPADNCRNIFQLDMFATGLLVLGLVTRRVTTAKDVFGSFVATGVDCDDDAEGFRPVDIESPHAPLDIGLYLPRWVQESEMGPYLVALLGSRPLSACEALMSLPVDSLDFSREVKGK